MIHQDFNDLNEESTREEELVFGRTSRVMAWDQGGKSVFRCISVFLKCIEIHGNTWKYMEMHGNT